MLDSESLIIVQDIIRAKRRKYFIGKTRSIKVPLALVDEVYKFIEQRDREFFEKASQIKCSELDD